MALKSPFAATLVAACVMAAALPAATSAATESPVPVHITYTGTGHFHMTNTVGGTSEATDEFQWTLEFKSMLNSDGGYTDASGSVDSWPGKYQFLELDQNVQCGDTIPTNPPPAIPGEDPQPPAVTPFPQLQDFELQSLTYLSPDEANPAYAQCQGTEPDGLQFDAEGIASDHVAGLLDNFLPGVMTAHLPPLPIQQFLAQHALHIATVSDASSIDKLPDSCASLYGEDNPSDCQMSLQWNGTVLIDGTAACPLILVGPGGLMCMPPDATVKQFEQGISENAPGAGSFGLTATAGAHASAAATHHKKKRAVVVFTAKAKVKHAGTVRLRPRPTAAGRAALRKAKRLKVTLRVVFTPKKGKKHVTTRALTLKR